MTHSRIRDLHGEDPYRLLGVDRVADRETIINAHRQRIQVAHPDRPGGDEETAKLVHLARDVLLDESLRREYDQLSTAGPAKPSAPGQASGRSSGQASGQSTGQGSARRSAWDEEDADGAPSAWDDDADDDDEAFGYRYDFEGGPIPWQPDPSVRPESYPPPYGDPPLFGNPPQYVDPPAFEYPPPAPVYPPPVVLPRIGTNLGPAIVSLFLFWPLGIPAVVYARRVNPALQAGDYVRAARAARDSRFCSRFALVIGAVALTAACCFCAGYSLLGSGLRIPGS